MSPASRSKSKDKKVAKEPQKASSKAPGHAPSGNGVPVSGYNPHLQKFHTIETQPLTSASPLHVNGRFRNIDETDEQSGNSPGTGVEYDTISNNDSWSGESEDHKEKNSHHSSRQEGIRGADSDKREKIRQKNEKKHQRQKERRAQGLHERCSGFLMSRKLESLAQQLVAMGFSSERATMALILNEGKIEESVAWLFEEGEEAGKYKEHNVDGGNLKIDISEELARIEDMEIRYNCSKQEVERAVVACEGDLEKAAETLTVQKQESPSVSQKPEETGDPLLVSNTKLSVSVNDHNSLRVHPKHSLPTTIQEKRDEKDFNYTKTAVVVGVPIESGFKHVQALRKGQPKIDWAKPQQIIMPADKRWTSAASNPSVSYSLASSALQATPPQAKTETRYVALGSELKNLQLGSVKEPVVVMQRPQVANGKQAPNTNISSSSSPPGTASGWYPNKVEVAKPNGLASHIPSTRSLALDNLSSGQLYNQLHNQHHQQFVTSNSGLVAADTLVGASQTRGNIMWNKTGTSPTLAAASSLGLFSGVGPNVSYGSSSPLDWNSIGGSMVQLDYMNIDWSLDRSSLNSSSGGSWQGMTSFMRNNPSNMYDSYIPGLSGRTAMRPASANGGGLQFAGLQDGGVAPVEMSVAGSREWSSPFEEKDLFSLPRQFVFSPSL